MRFSTILAVLLIFSGCASVPQPRTGGSDEKAVRILQQSAEAHGWAALQERQAVNVSFAGEWSPVVDRLQPVLVDKPHRGTSVERYPVAAAGTIRQTHVGSAGTKRVEREKDATRVWIDGEAVNDPEVIAAAALVADNYRMFLFGPGFFLQRNAPVQYLGRSTVDGFACVNLLAVLRPGIGQSAEDRVILSIDREQHYLRRVRITIEGLESTRGAVADIYLRDHLRIDGILWPSTFYESLQRPLSLPVHNWRLTAIDYD